MVIWFIVHGLTSFKQEKKEKEMIIEWKSTKQINNAKLQGTINKLVKLFMWWRYDAKWHCGVSVFKMSQTFNTWHDTETPWCYFVSPKHNIFGGVKMSTIQYFQITTKLDLFLIRKTPYCWVEIYWKLHKGSDEVV